MHSRKKEVKDGREKLLRVIEMCKSIENRSLDPFLIDVDEIIRIVREYFPNWNKPEDLCLDAEAVNSLASVIKLQSEWVKQRSTSLYTDPFLLEEKIRRMDKEIIVETFLKAWHPIVEQEQISILSLKEAIHYWESLTPLRERWKDLPPPEAGGGYATREELIRERIMEEKAFSEEMEKFWEELKSLVKEKGENGKIKYWDFIGAETYMETMHRAFMASFLVTYGYATLEIHQLEDETYIKPYEKQLKRKGGKQLVSIPIAITYEDWMKWRTGELK
ncbi:MAG: hypothetical protein QXV01_05080 [Candidatus Bathyarchaeia archaeon]